MMFMAHLTLVKIITPPEVFSIPGVTHLQIFSVLMVTRFWCYSRKLLFKKNHRRHLLALIPEFSRTFYLHFRNDTKLQSQLRLLE